MFFYRTIVLDCGASRTALGVFSRKQGGHLRLGRYEVERFPMPGGETADWLEQTRNALTALRRRVKTAGPVVLVLPAHLALARHLAIPAVSPIQREKIIRFEAGQNIPYALADVVWTSMVTGECESGLDVLLSAAKLEVVEPLCAAVRAAGFALKMILPSPMATWAGFNLVLAQSSRPVLGLNLGARSTTLLYGEGEHFVLRSMAFGGDGITRQIALEQGCAVGQAETLKIAGNGPERVALAAEAFATRLTQEITRSLLHFGRWKEIKAPVHIYLAGGGAHLSGLSEALALKLKIPVSGVDIFGALEVAGAAIKAGEADDAHSLCDLAGAAATRLRRLNRQVPDLLPPRWRRDEARRRRQPWLIAAAVVAITALLWPIGQMRKVATEAGRRTAAIERGLPPLREREVRDRAQLQRLDELKRQIVRLQDLYDRRARWAGLLADLQGRLGQTEDVWLEKIRIAPAAPGAPLKLAVSGCMLDRTNPLGEAGPGISQRVRSLLAGIVDSPFVTAIENERFDHSQPGILKFDFVLATDPRRPL